MPSAIVLINADLNSEDLITNKLKEIDGVTAVYKVHGVYDIVAKVEGQTLARVKEIIQKTEKDKRHPLNDNDDGDYRQIVCCEEN